MKQSVFVSVASAAVVAAHGIVSDLKIGDVYYGGYNPYQDKYMNPVPERIVWAFPDGGNGPVEDVSSSDITCNKAATAAPISAAVNAGEDITFYWTEWPESHKGPVMTYMANCGGDCSSADATSLSFFKIDHEGYDGTTWASDNLIANNNSWTVTVPSDIAAGNYLIRHEILALHSAGNANGAQFYPMCANLEVSSSGSANPEGVKFPGAYTAEDPGILVSIYNGLTTYEIPGPDVYGGGGSSSSSSGSVRAGSSSSKVAAAPTIPTAVGTTPESPSSEAEVDAPAFTSAIGNIPDLAISAIAGIFPTSAPSVPEASSPSVPEVSAEVEPTGAAAIPNLPSINIPNFTSVPTAPVEIEAPVAVGPTASVAIPTFASAGGFGGFGGFGAIPTAAGAATTLVTSTRAGAVETAAAGTGSGSVGSGASGQSVSINQCLDEVNACIASMQSKTGGAVDFSSCEAKRANCQ